MYAPGWRMMLRCRQAVRGLKVAAMPSFPARSAGTIWGRTMEWKIMQSGGAPYSKESKAHGASSRGSSVPGGGRPEADTRPNRGILAARESF
jgi:hypothetical protein